MYVHTLGTYVRYNYILHAVHIYFRTWSKNKCTLLFVVRYRFDLGIVAAYGYWVSGILARYTTIIMELKDKHQYIIPNNCCNTNYSYIFVSNTMNHHCKYVIIIKCIYSTTNRRDNCRPYWYMIYAFLFFFSIVQSVNTQFIYFIFDIIRKWKQ